MAQMERSCVSDGEIRLERTFINQLNNIDSRKVLLRGWVHKIKDLINVSFIKLRG